MASLRCFFALLCVLIFAQSDAYWQCDFEADDCRMLEFQGKEKFNWKRNKGYTRSELTGPYSAHGGDWYIYSEATGWETRKGDVTQATTKPVYSPGQYCLSFWFSMFGRHMGSLRVIQEGSNEKSEERKEIWSYSCPFRNAKWYQMNITTYMDRLDRLIFEAVRGSSHGSDMAIDDLFLQKC